MEAIQNMRAIRIKFLAPTNYKGSRIKITEQRFDFVDSITLSYDYQIGNGTNQAIGYLQKRGINLVGKAEVKNETILFSDSWQRGENDFITIK